MKKALHFHFVAVAVLPALLFQVLKETYGIADKIQEAGPCIGYYQFAETAGEDIISVERARQIARSHNEDVCFDTVKSKPENVNIFGFFSRPGRGYEATKLLFKDSELKRVVFSWIGGDWNTYFSLPENSIVWKGRPDKSVIENRLGKAANSALHSIELNSIFSQYAKSGTPVQSAISIRRGIDIWKGAPAYDACFDFGNRGTIRFQLLPGGLCVFCGKLNSFSRPIEFDLIKGLPGTIKHSSSD